MMEPNNSIRFDNQQPALVDEFRKRRNTSVLTAMFTDMKDYTNMTEEKGDEYSSRMIDLSRNSAVPTASLNRHN